MYLLDKKTLILLSIFAIIALAITAGAIYYTKSKESNNIQFEKINNVFTDNILSNTQTITPDNLGIKSLQDKYDLNDLLIINQNDTYGDKISNQNSYNWNIEYVKIQGLKNKTIENKINQSIEQQVKNYIVKDAPKGEAYFISTYCTANYSNILSMIIHNSYYEQNKNNFQKCINYDLNTGNEINFNELFTNVTSVKNIISKCAYNSIALEIGSEKDLGADMNNIDYSNVNDRVFNILAEYNSGTPIEFYFTARQIYAFIAGENFNIDMRDYYENIAIYNRYASNKNLYETSYSAEKNVYVFLDRIGCYYSKLENNSDNIYTDFKLGLADTNKVINNKQYMTIIEDYKNYFNNQLLKYKEYLNQNKDKAILYAVTAELEINDDGKATIIQDIQKFEMDKNYFQTYKAKALEYVQGTDSDEAVYEFTNPYYIDDENASKEYIQNEIIYNIEEGTYTIKSDKYEDSKQTTTSTTYKIKDDEKISENIIENTIGY